MSIKPKISMMQRTAKYDLWIVFKGIEAYMDEKGIKISNKIINKVHIKFFTIYKIPEKFDKHHEKIAVRSY